MVGTISLNIGGPLEGRIQNDPEFREGVTLQRALQFPGEVMLVLTGYFNRCDSPSHHSQTVISYFREGNTPHVDLKEALEYSDRLRIDLRMSYAGDTISITCSFFDRYKRKANFVLHAYVDKTGMVHIGSRD